MHVLVVGSGGREHALALALQQSPLVSRLSMAPGNPGMEPLGQPLAIDPMDFSGLLLHAKREAVELVVVGPEAPLAEGLADALMKEGIAVFGPTQAAAQLEASKHFAKQVMNEAGVATAHFVYCNTQQEALTALEGFTAPYVVKEEALAAGKGVTVATTVEEAIEAIEQAFAKAGTTVLLEQFLHGQELSVFAVCDGETALPLVAAQDFKRIGNGHTGPNTGGMGAYAPVAFATPALMQHIHQEVLTPMVQAMKQRGTPYVGLLYAGLMISPAGEPVVIEFNCRFGDPETQVVVPLLQQAGVDVGELLWKATQQQLHTVSLPPVNGAAVTVVMASKGYPGAYATGLPITLPQQPVAGVTVYHAGTKRLPGGALVTNGGRVLSVTALASTVQQAREKAYAAVSTIVFEGAYYRTDIGGYEKSLA